MPKESPTTYPPTLVFTRVESFLETVQARGIRAIGCATLRRSSPFGAGMGERRVSFILLTARDHVHDEILSCSVYLSYADYVGEQRCMPHEEWERERARGERVQRQLLDHLRRVPELRILDAAYHVHPDVSLRFAAFVPAAGADAAGS